MAKNGRTMKLMAMIAAAMVACSAPGSAQWTRTAGPEGGRVTTVAASGATTLMTTASGELYRHREGGWEHLGTLAAARLIASGDVFLAVVDGNILRSTDQGSSWRATGLIGVDPILETDGEILYALVNDAILRSVDHGAAWRPVPTGEMSTPFSAIAARGRLLIVGNGLPGGFLRSSDDGGSWSRIENAGLPADGIAKAFIATDIDFYAILDGKGIYRSTDAGVTWAGFNTGIPERSGVYPSLNGLTAVAGDLLWTASPTAPYLHDGEVWRQQDAELDASFSLGDGALYRAAASGLARSTDGGRSWSTMNSGLVATDVTAFGALGDAIFCNGGDAIFRSTDRGAHWTSMGRLGAVEFATSGGAIFARGAAHTGFGIMRSDDGGITWNERNVGLTEPLDALSALAANDRTLFAGFGQFGDGTSGMIWSRGGIFRSTDGGGTWTGASLGLPIRNGVTVPILSILAHGDTLLATTADGLFRSADGGGRWGRVTPPEGASVILEKLAWSDGGFFVGGMGAIYRSTNGGAGWVALDPGFPPFSTIVSISPVAGGILVVVEETSGMRRVFRLDGALWSEISPALPQGVSPTGFIVAGERVLAGTQGSGVWSAPLGNVASAGPSSADPMNGREAYPNPFSAGTTIEFMMPRRGHATLAIVDLAGVVVRTAFDGMLGAGVHAVRISGTGLPAGAYLYRVVVDGRTVGTGEIVKR